MASPEVNTTLVDSKKPPNIISISLSVQKDKHIKLNPFWSLFSKLHIFQICSFSMTLLMYTNYQRIGYLN